MSSIGIITALPAEAKSFSTKKLEPGRVEKMHDDYWVYISGMGADNAVAGIETLAVLGVKIIINLGIAGALDAGYNSGDLVIPLSIIKDSEKININPDWHKRVCDALGVYQDITVHTDNLVSSDVMLGSRSDKIALGNKSECKSVDMEGYALALKAKQLDIDFISIKSIADEVGVILPACVLKYTDQYGRPELKNFILDLIRQPSQIRQLVSLAHCFNRAIKTLTRIENRLFTRHFYHPTAET